MHIYAGTMFLPRWDNGLYVGTVKSKGGWACMLQCAQALPSRVGEIATYVHTYIFIQIMVYQCHCPRIQNVDSLTRSYLRWLPTNGSMHRHPFHMEWLICIETQTNVEYCIQTASIMCIWIRVADLFLRWFWTPISVSPDFVLLDVLDRQDSELRTNVWPIVLYSTLVPSLHSVMAMCWWTGMKKSAENPVSLGYASIRWPNTQRLPDSCGKFH